MSAYAARFTGETTITPPLSWQELHGSPGLEDLRVRIHEDITETPLGQNRVLTGVAITAAHDFEYGGYGMEGELEALLRAHGKKHVFAGCIEALGEEGDRWRLTVRDGQVVRQVGRTVWEDEPETRSEEKNR